MGKRITNTVLDKHVITHHMQLYYMLQVVACC